jgi:hypothetical protein
MQPLAIVDFFDEEGKPALDIVHRPVFPEVDLLGLQGLEEALGGRVVVGVTFPGHADPEAVLKKRVHVVVGLIDKPDAGGCCLWCEPIGAWACALIPAAS